MVTLRYILYMQPIYDKNNLRAAVQRAAARGATRVKAPLVEICVKQITVMTCVSTYNQYAKKYQSNRNSICGDVRARVLMAAFLSAGGMRSGRREAG